MKHAQRGGPTPVGAPDPAKRPVLRGALLQIVQKEKDAFMGYESRSWWQNDSNKVFCELSSDATIIDEYSLNIGHFDKYIAPSLGNNSFFSKELFRACTSSEMNTIKIEAMPIDSLINHFNNWRPPFGDFRPLPWHSPNENNNDTPGIGHDPGGRLIPLLPVRSTYRR
ncbi:hypothetical protein [Roseospira visakhapatnamensis]|uniref:Uncharacterized protein n=1 Tax=Roseospira visakhapatnamensis TaxID=390880 RepID=A0A7W6RH70_9PROT|nr:hypothetical protein [Roseospira visakhapatnamensis]MBB4268290.1 hypothetical protein [Roseospira visakhapatnamensis]